MKSNLLYILFLFLAIVVLLNNQCSYSNSELDTNINTVWYKAYSSESPQKVKIGLHWYLNYLGAELPKGCFDSIQIKNKVPFEMNMKNFGFNDESLRAWSQIIKQIKKTEEYKSKNAIDVGRLIMLTLNSTWHYYKITGAEKKYKSAANKYEFDEKLYALQKGESCIAYNDRKVMIADGSDLKSTAFVGLEGSGKISEDSYKVHEFELMEIMDNGFFRFAVYDDKGKLMKGSSRLMSDAGKPAKCLWCHAQNLNPAFLAETNLEGYYSVNDFKAIIDNKMEDIRNYRLNLKREINIREGENHENIEILYISFMEPSAMRLAGEWNMPIAKVKELLADQETHEHHEFEYLGDLYHRLEIDNLANFKPINVPEDARETSEYEPNFFWF